MENELDESPRALHDIPYVLEIDDAEMEIYDAKSETAVPEIYAEDSNDEPPTSSGGQVIGEESDAMPSKMAFPEIFLEASSATSANDVRAIV